LFTTNGSYSSISAILGEYMKNVDQASRLIHGPMFDAMRAITPGWYDAAAYRRPWINAASDLSAMALFLLQFHPACIVYDILGHGLEQLV